MQEQPCISIMGISIDMLDPLRVERALDWISVTHHLSLIPGHRLQTGSSLITRYASLLLGPGLTTPDSVLNSMNPCPVESYSDGATNPTDSTTLLPSAR